MSQSLTIAIAAMRDAVEHDSPTMFWGEAMTHVAVLLEHINQQRNVSVGTAMPPEINNHLLAWIVDQVDTIEDDSVIRDIYRLIAADQASFIATEYAQGAPASLQSVLAERIRQIQVECFYPEHDDENTDGSLAMAAACYAEEAFYQAKIVDRLSAISQVTPVLWPWTPDIWKPTDQRQNLVKAGALILAEIDRLDRAAALAQKEQHHV
ncbi:hypothetical protein [Pseudomonas sp. WS 5079]|uniref:hypothetical protein n=1 Tax=Pseudomonas sp. WS 5079 TaxID=2717492 RepID=UPI0016AD2E0C|nr:hypothetical protein [Pseudomonas sp. WS 5079]NMX64732.1 hypothetical protein [Pseudomonas sp. WS 5079]